MRSGEKIQRNAKTGAWEEKKGGDTPAYRTLTFRIGVV